MKAALDLQPVSRAKGFLKRRRPEQGDLESIDGRIADGDQDPELREEKKLLDLIEYHIARARVELVRMLWTHDIYLTASVVDRAVFGLARDPRTFDLADKG